jgi:hypothetical protein
METIKVKKETDKFGIVVAVMYARQCNFPDYNSPLNKMMHGTEFLHGLLKDKIITNDQYQKLKRVAEDPNMEYKIVVQ